MTNYFSYIISKINIIPIQKREVQRGTPPTIHLKYKITLAFLVAQMLKNLPAVQETWVQSLVWEDPLEQGMTTHSSILAWRIPIDRGPRQATVHGVTKSQTRLSDYAHTQKERIYFLKIDLKYYDKYAM